MVKLQEAIVVEGRYDKNTLSQLVEAPIFETNGFSIMKDKKKMSLLRQVAKSRGLIVFTDSDGAGFVIRNYIKGAISADQLKHAYIPEVFGKEKRKKTPGKEGKLGVEGMSPDVILQCLYRAGATVLGEKNIVPAAEVTKQDLYELGLSGGTDSKRKRTEILKRLELPVQMSSNAMLQVLNLLYTRDELIQILDQL